MDYKCVIVSLDLGAGGLTTLKHGWISRLWSLQPDRSLHAWDLIRTVQGLHTPLEWTTWAALVGTLRLDPGWNRL